MSDVRVQRLIDERDVEQVFVRYFDRVDAGDAKGAALLFAEDVTAEIMTGKVYSGRKWYERALAQTLAQYERTSHHITNVRVEVDDDEAIAVLYVYAFHRMANTGEPWHLWARLVDRLRRTRGGWLITDHRLFGVDGVPDREAVPADFFSGHPGRQQASRT
jgi:uncharacterized protein (TIGR02246 family)